MLFASDLLWGMVSGGVLLSHTVPGAVPSALEGLASGFGMGPGVPPPPKPPTTLFNYYSIHSTMRPATGQGGGVLRVTQWMRVLRFCAEPVAGRVLLWVKSSAY